MSTQYDSTFYAERHQSTLYAAGKVADIVMPTLTRTKSAIDFGAGTGTWLSAFQARGVTELAALEGPWVKDIQKSISEATFTYCDLSQPPTQNHTFDLAISLEVGEHLPKRCAESFVNALCSASPNVLFSAAIPGQGGVHHVNEQWQQYWVDIFASQGYQCADIIRPKLWDDQRIAVHYRQNMFLFHQKPLACNTEDHRSMLTPSLVHPDLARSWPPTLRSSSRIFLASAMRHIGSKLRISESPTFRSDSTDTQK